MKRSRMIGILLLVVLLIVVGAGTAFWYLFYVDEARLMDQTVTEQWLEKYISKPALPFFAAGGRLVDFGDEQEADSLDATVVVPLLKRLEAEAKMQWLVLVDDDEDESAFAIVAELPSRPRDRAVMKTVIAEQAEQFDGKIIEPRGYRWTTLEFLTAEEVELLGK